MCDFFPPVSMSAHGLLSSVFSCSPVSRSVFKRRLRHSRSLDPALMRRHGSEADEPTGTGDFTWNSESGRRVGLQPVPLQSLSELERVRLRDVAYCRLMQAYDLDCQITVPKDGQKRKKSLRRKLDALSKEKSKDKDHLPQAFGLPLAAVIANDRAYKQRLDSGPAPPSGEALWGRRREQGEESQPRDAGGDLPFSFLPAGSPATRPSRELSSSNSSLSSSCETPTEPPPPAPPPAARPDSLRRIRRRGGVSVDCITGLDDNQSRLLEALQLSLPVEAASNRKKHRDKKLSLNPMYQQVPRVVHCCCQHLEKYGLQTVGIFRVGSSRKRVKQLREEFDRGEEVLLEEEQSVHDVAALLKEFLRDMPDPLLTRELYPAFVNSIELLDNSDQVSALQLLIYLLPPCNSDTLQRLLHFLFTVAAHADDGHAADGAEITGNKMTPVNLATIFGPNLLHKQKNSDKEFAVQSFARAEESSAVISVVESLISNYQTLFMVPCDLQNQVLMSVLETDTDVVDYLLRRKDSQYSSSSLLRPAPDEDSDLLSDRRSSYGSPREEDSSGEVSPYDNNSPVLSDPGVRRGRGGATSPPSDAGRYRRHGAHWDNRALPQERRKTRLPSTGEGYHGDGSECESSGSSAEGLHRCRGDGPPVVRRTQSSLAPAGYRPHAPLTRCSSGGGPGQRPRLRGQSGATASSEDLGAGPDAPGARGQLGAVRAVAADGGAASLLQRFPGPLRDDRMSNSAPSLCSGLPGGRSAASSPPPPPPHAAGAPAKPPLTPGPATGGAWHVRTLLCAAGATADALPESLV